MIRPERIPWRGPRKIRDFAGQKKLHDKRDDMAKRDAHREMDRVLKDRNR